MGRPWLRYVGLTLAERVLQRIVESDGPLDTPCWLWTGSVTANGYGQIKHAGRVHRCHRVLWVAAHGPVPSGRELDHVCRVPRCCRPDHLEAVTRQANVARAYA